MRLESVYTVTVYRAVVVDAAVDAGRLDAAGVDAREAQPAIDRSHLDRTRAIGDHDTGVDGVCRDPPPSPLYAHPAFDRVRLDQAVAAAHLDRSLDVVDRHAAACAIDRDRRVNGVKLEVHRARDGHGVDDLLLLSA